MKKNKNSTYSRRDFLEGGLKLSVLGALYSPLQSAAQVVPFGFWKKLSTTPPGPPLPPSSPGGLFSWGLGGNGRLGTNNNTTRSSPVAVGALTTWTKVSANSASALALKSDGTLWAWGVNTNGQHGTGNTTTRSSPVQVGALTTWTEVSFGGLDDSGTSFAIKSDGTLWGWGSNRFCVLNATPGDNTDRSSPVQIGTDTNWKSISVSGTASFATMTETHVHAVKTDGTLWSWGSNCRALIGADPHRPLKLAFGSVTQFTTGGYAGHMLRSDGSLWGFAPSYGIIGDGDASFAVRNYPIRVNADTDWSYLASAPMHSMAIKTDNTLWAWGANTVGQLGVIGGDRSTPTQVPGAWSKVVLGGGDIFDSNTAYSMGIQTDGTLWGWGANANGQLGVSISPTQVGSGADWAQVCVGEEHVLAIKSDGTLWSWGGNGAGELGDGTTTDRSSPVQVGALTDWAKVAIAAGTSLAIKTDGTLWAWGNNGYGQLGNGNTSNRSSPVQIGAATDWLEIQTSNQSSYGIRSGGTMWAWGYNHIGQLGDLSMTNRSSPVQVGSAIAWSQISAGEYFCAAVAIGGALYTWGNNGNGQLGNNSTTARSSPVQVGALNNWASVHAGDSHVIASKTNGTMWAWGGNYYGSLGTNNTTSRSSPVQVGALTNWATTAAVNMDGEGVSYAIKSDGTLWSWGSNVQGLLGDSSGIGRSSPVQVGTVNYWTQISSKGYTTMAIRSDGTLWVWGSKAFNKWGFATTVASGQVGSDTNWADVATGVAHTLAVKTNGTLWSWGLNDFGQLGSGSVVSTMSPVQVGALTNWSKVSVGGSASAAIKTDGTLWTWGNNTHGKLGHGNTTSRSSPVQVGTGTNWSKVVCNSSTYGEYMLATKSDGTMWAWGVNTAAELGDGTTTNRSSPVQVGSATTWVSPLESKNTAGHAGGVQSDGSIWVWGFADYGFFSAPPGFFAPVQVGTDTNWHMVSSGLSHVVAIKTDGSIWSWGENYSGQIGDYSTDLRSLPTQVGVGTDWAAISAGNEFTAAIKTNGTLWSWGNAANGALGDNTTTNKSSPIQVGALTNWKYVSCGKDSFALAVKTDGTLWAWGNGASGRLGNSSITTLSSPVQVGALTTWISVAASQQSSHGIKS